MGIQISNQNQYSVGLNPNLKLNNFGNRVYFGHLNTGDSFQNNSPALLFDENFVKRMMSQNPEIKKILSANKLPENINTNELLTLKESHCKDTQEIASSIAKNLPPALKQQVNMKDLKDAALLHDFGKVLIPPEVLNKNGALTPEEHAVMDLHSELGYQLLKNSGVNDEVLQLVRYHHNNFDKNGKVIPDINLQILNLADQYSALTEKRVYKEEYTPKKALTILYAEVKKGNIHPMIFNALVKSLQNRHSQQSANIM